MTRALISILGGTALCFSSLTCAVAAPLAPGGAAGVKQAQTWERIPIWGYVGGVLVIVGFVAVVAGGSSGHAAGQTCISPSGTNTCTSGGGGSSSTGSTGTT